MSYRGYGDGGDGSGGDAYDPAEDPALRLRTVRTAASTIAESIRAEDARDERRKRKDKGKKRSRFLWGGSRDPRAEAVDVEGKKAPVAGPRRLVHVGVPLGRDQLRSNGEPSTRYVRNKIRTSKYTLLTFIPKNLYEQFRRVANIFFLLTVILAVQPLFGAAGSQISFLPLTVVLIITAIKDGLEDYRRTVSDTELNNSPATRLASDHDSPGHWRNVNVPRDGRTFFEKLMGQNRPGDVTRGVRRLREREGASASTITIVNPGASMQSLGTKASMTSMFSDNTKQSPYDELGALHSYPPSVHGSMGRHSEGADTLRSLPGDTYTRAMQQRARAFSIESAASTRESATTVAQQAQRTVDPASRAVITGTPSRAEWERTLWKKVEVGDIVLLRNNDQIPADVVVLATSDAQGDGLCYVETKNLDGETNLKVRKACTATRGIMTEEDISRARFVLDSEGAQPNLYVYNGVLRFGDDGQNAESVTIANMLLRGCTLRNTEWVVGIVVFTGADSKILLNGGETPSKRSKIEKETNFNVVMNFIILMVMCVVTAVMSSVFEARTGTSADFFEVGAEPTGSLVLNALVTLGSSLIAFQNIVPISLYISIEIVKTIQAFFIFQDIDMYYAELDTPCVPKTWNISDDLGQIAYIFSDKTGTLTRNVMEFQKCAVRGVRYGEGVTEAQRGAMVRRGEKGESHEEVEERLVRGKEEMLDVMRRAFSNRYLREDCLTLISPRLAQDLTTEGQQRDHLIAFFRALAICHTVLAEKLDEDGAVLEYKAESPDEAALVAGARDAGFAFVERAGGTITLNVLGQNETHTPLRVLEFSSARKRMSVLARDAAGRVVLYSKGADSVIFDRLAANHDQGVKDQTRADLDEFANEGLRTLCVARRYLGEEAYRDWERRYDAALAIVGEERDDEVEKVCDEVECDLEILGATALEDKLQEGVPEAIELLHKAGIKLWILTGDKVQTAIEIAFSCNLLTQSMDVMILAADTPESARAQIQAGLDRIASVRGIGGMSRRGTPAPDGVLQTLPKRPEEIAAAQAKGERPSFAVVIDGDTLRYALDDRLKPLFLDLGTQCETVVCCRVSPAQKALTVKLVKDGRNAMTLSIGDGANDVAMIQEANIGCGLFGHEGSQAAMSADYAFGQFRFLTKLLLVHGRWSYIRVAEMHGNFFYKNVVWTLASFWFLFWNSFDATYLYEYTFIMLFNLVFSSLPVIVLGAFDQDLNAKASIAFPRLYERGIRGKEYTRAVFWTYMLDGLYQSAVVFFVPFMVYTFSISASWNGKAMDSLADYGTTVAVSAVCVVNLYVGMNTRYWTGMTWFVVIGSCVVVMLWVGVYSFFPSVQFQDEVVVLFGNMQFWGTFGVTIVISLGPRFIGKFVQQAWFPLDRDIIREAWVMGDLKDRLGVPHRRDRKRHGQGDLEGQEMLGAVDPPSQTSTVDDARGAYMPAATHSPAGFGKSRPLQPPPQQFDMNVIRPSTDPYGVDRDQGQELEMPQTGYTGGHHNRMQPSAMSYYSASDIPMSSPVRGPSHRLPSDHSPSPQPHSPYAHYSTAPSSAQSHSPYGPSPSSPSGQQQQPPSPYGQQQQHPHSPLGRSPSQQRSPYGAAPGPALGLQPGPSTSPSSYSPQHTSPQGAGGPPSSWRQQDDGGRAPSRVSSRLSREGSFVTADEHWTQEGLSDDDDAHTVRAPGPRASGQSFQGGFAI
ncbi:phospholipid-translocating P-type ATPase [Auricularia subglabra TFB-10046 SS5]|nr:phospholipid-translocating P-type ATPase [Auricularia subglabra TFB-10046 SS5]